MSQKFFDKELSENFMEKDAIYKLIKTEIFEDL